MKHLLVGVDGSAVSQSALVWAAQIAAKSGAEIVAANCFRAPYTDKFPENYNRPLEERHRTMNETWLPAAIEIGAKVEGIVRFGDPRDLLLPIAEAEEVDLLVLGRSGAGAGPGFLHLGSVVEYAAHHTRIPLAVIPEQKLKPIERIVLGVDGSPESLAAISWVADLAPTMGASVMAVKVTEPYFEWAPATGSDNWRIDAERYIEKWTSPLAELGVDVYPHVKRDIHPADGLLEVAASQEADLLVVGTRGVGGFSGLRAGGVALKLLHRANLPLVMVPEM